MTFMQVHLGWLGTTIIIILTKELASSLMNGGFKLSGLLLHFVSSQQYHIRDMPLITVRSLGLAAHCILIVMFYILFQFVFLCFPFVGYVIWLICSMVNIMAVLFNFGLLKHQFQITWTLVFSKFSGQRMDVEVITESFWFWFWYSLFLLHALDGE